MFTGAIAILAVIRFQKDVLWLVGKYDDELPMMSYLPLMSLTDGVCTL